MTVRGFRMVGASAISSVGRDLAETLASVRLSVQRVRDSEVVGADGHRVPAACVYPVAPHLGGVARQSALFAAPVAAVEEHLPGSASLIVCGQAWPDLDPAMGPLGEFASSYEAYREIPCALAAQIASRLEGRGCTVASSSVHFGGHTAALDALRVASEQHRIILCASCCFVDPFGLHLLSVARASGGLDPSFVPGEASVVLVLEPASVHDADVVVGPTVRSEPYDSLAEAANELFDAVGSPLPPVTEVWSDCNGERWRAQAYAFAALRAWGRLGMTPEQRDAARSLGNVGAAAGASQLALAWSAVDRGGAALVTAQNRDGSAVAALVRESPR